MKVQRITLPNQNQTSWVVLDDAYYPVLPIQSFLTYLNNIERSPNTVRAYAHHLKLFWEYLADRKLNWTAVGVQEMADFINWLRDPRPLGVTAIHARVAQRTERTINTILAAVVTFYDYHARLGAGPDIPWYRFQALPQRRYKSFLHGVTKTKSAKTHILKLKAPKQIPKTLDSEQVTSLINACRHRRDQFLVRLLYETGMRVGEALGLRHEDIKYWENTIWVIPRQDNRNATRVKSGQARRLDVNRDLLDLYLDYLSDEYGDPNNDYVFINLWEGAVGRPMAYGTVSSLFQQIGKKVGIQVHPHMLRHTHATELIRQGVALAVVARRLGHTSAQTTSQIYEHLTADDLKREMQAFHQRKGHSQ